MALPFSHHLELYMLNSLTVFKGPGMLLPNILWFLYFLSSP